MFFSTHQPLQGVPFPLSEEQQEHSCIAGQLRESVIGEGSPPLWRLGTLLNDCNLHTILFRPSAWEQRRDMTILSYTQVYPIKGGSRELSLRLWYG